MQRKDKDGSRTNITVQCVLGTRISTRDFQQTLKLVFDFFLNSDTDVVNSELHRIHTKLILKSIYDDINDI